MCWFTSLFRQLRDLEKKCRICKTLISVVSSIIDLTIGKGSKDKRKVHLKFIERKKRQTQPGSRDDDRNGLKNKCTDAHETGSLIKSCKKRIFAARGSLNASYCSAASLLLRERNHCCQCSSCIKRKHKVKTWDFTIDGTIVELQAESLVIVLFTSPKWPLVGGEFQPHGWPYFHAD